MTPMTPMTPITTRTIKNKKKIKKSKKSKKNATRKKNRGMVGGITPEKFAKDEATSMDFNNNLIALPDGTTVMKNKLEDFMGKPTGDIEYTISYKGNKVPKILIEKTKKDGPTTMKKKIKGKVLDLSPNDPEDAKDVAKLKEYKKKAEENIAKRKEEVARAAKVEVEVAAPVAKVTRSIPRNFHGELTGDIDYTIVDEQGKQNMLRRKQDGSFKKIIVKNYVSQESDTFPDDEKDIQKVNEFDAEHPIDVDSPTFRAKFPLVANPEAAAKITDVIAPAPVNPPLPETEAGSELAAPPPANPEAAENVDVIAPAPVNPPLQEAEAISEVAAAAPVNPPLQEAEISGEASAPPQETEISGEASAPPQETEISGEASAPPQETEISGEASAPPQEAEISGEASAPPQETEISGEASAPPQETEAEISSEMDAAGKALREEAKRLQEKLDALKSQLNMISEAAVESTLEPEPVAATPETAGGGGGLNKMMKKWKKTFHKKYNSKTSMKRKNKTNRNKYNMDHFVL